MKFFTLSYSRNSIELLFLQFNKELFFNSIGIWLPRYFSAILIESHRSLILHFTKFRSPICSFSLVSTLSFLSFLGLDLNVLCLLKAFVMLKSVFLSPMYAAVSAAEARSLKYFHLSFLLDFLKFCIHCLVFSTCFVLLWPF